MHYSFCCILSCTSAAGWVDIQVNGYGCNGEPVDFSSCKLTSAQFSAACWTLIQSGSVAFLPTVITSSLDTYKHVLSVIDQTLAGDAALSSFVLGVHLEGPFLSPMPGAAGSVQHQTATHSDAIAVD